MHQHLNHTGHKLGGCFEGTTRLAARLGKNQNELTICEWNPNVKKWRFDADLYKAQTTENG